MNFLMNFGKLVVSQIMSNVIHTFVLIIEHLIIERLINTLFNIFLIIIFLIKL
ncbi:hypothetical protein Metbo_1992 [Methanobacterium lacus]|uniref:Uncharacterized protein n=1 Tax=Methanobacterium lacus (strain AL-21) TaxID=877455 RepID=F0TBE3_METLA|nr:hypothetical protein Metbo_1992 [Methanobacterium lacus]